MAIPRNIPQVVVLLGKVEQHNGSKPTVHDEFVSLASIISQNTKEYISPTTLERVWGYSTRGYENISLRTLNVLCRYAGYNDWESFCEALKSDSPIESDLFDRESITTDDLRPGDVLVVGWPPNRICEIEYLGCNRFITLKALNAKLQAGDTFSCLAFQLGSPLYLENVTKADGETKAVRYGAGLRHGLTMLQLKKI